MSKDDLFFAHSRLLFEALVAVNEHMKEAEPELYAFGDAYDPALSLLQNLARLTPEQLKKVYHRAIARRWKNWEKKYGDASSDSGKGEPDTD